MLSDDIFKSRLRSTIAAIEAWAQSLAGVAAVETERDDVTWRIAIRPHAPQACPLELSLRTDQRFDFVVGPETYEDEPIESLDAFLPMLQAIAAGRVLTRRRTTAATGLPVDVSTVLMAADDAAPFWQRSRSTLVARPLRMGDVLVDDEHYAPYARGA